MQHDSTEDTRISARGRARKPTLRTIAERTGFAVTTVSRALAGDERIAEATRATVSEAARAVGYVPDRAAQRLRTGRTKVISLLINPEHEFLGFTDELLAGISRPLKATDYSVTIIPDLIDGDRVSAVQNILRNNLADGLIFTRTECFDERVRLLLEEDFPFITHGRTDFGTPHPFVDYDNEAFARAAVERLVEKGRERISIILPDARFTFAQHLRYGFLAAARGAGIEYTIEDTTLHAAPQVVADHLTKRLQGPDAPDGLVCVGEVTALASRAALQDTGKILGRDVDIVAKRASPIFDLLRPRIETVSEDVRATGEMIGALLLKRIDGAPVEQLQHVQAPGGRFGDGS
ncbi:MAG: LacI family transcriptional regulator [Pseudomonadota bacterium]